MLFENTTVRPGQVGSVVKSSGSATGPEFENATIQQEAVNQV